MTHDFSDALPYYYFEMAHLLFTECADEFRELQKTKSVIEDIHAHRQKKLFSILKKVEAETPVYNLSNVTSAEINIVRPGFSAMHSAVHKMQQTKERATADEEQE